MLKPRWLVAGIVLLCAAVGYKAWHFLGQPLQPAPVLAGKAVDGRMLDLSQSLLAAKGRPVMVVFWATWCPDCLAEQDGIESISRDYDVIAVAWRSEGNDAVAAHMRKYGLTYPTLNDVDGRIADAWNVRGVPKHFIIRPDSQVRFSVSGREGQWKLRLRLWWASVFHN